MSEPRTDIITVRVSDDEKLEVARAAALRGMKASEYVRHAALTLARADIDGNDADTVAYRSAANADSPVVRLPSLRILGGLAQLTAMPVVNADDPEGRHAPICPGCLGDGTGQTCPLRRDGKHIMLFHPGNQTSG